MPEEEFVPYKDISELKKEVEGMRGKKDIPAKELYDAVQKLSQTMNEMLDIFGAAAEQMKLEEKEYEASAKKHEMIISKLDKLIDQNKTIAEGMVAVVELVKEKFGMPSREEEPLPKPKPEPMQFKRPPQPEWQLKPEPIQRTQPIMMPPPTPITTSPSPDFGQLPPMQPAPLDLDFPDIGLEEEPKKKSLFGMFKK